MLVKQSLVLGKDNHLLQRESIVWGIEQELWSQKDLGSSPASDTSIWKVRQVTDLISKPQSFYLYNSYFIGLFYTIDVTY